MQYAHSLQRLLLYLLMFLDLQAPREMLALLAFLGEMATLAFQDSQVYLVLLDPLESVNHVLLLIRNFLPNMTHMMSSLEQEEQAILGQLVLQALQVPLALLDILAPLVLQDIKVPLVSLVKLVLPVLQVLLVLLVHLVLLEKMESQGGLEDLESVDCLDLQVSKVQQAFLDSLV